MGSKFNDDDFVAPEAEGGYKFLKAAVIPPANPNGPKKRIPINSNCTLVGKVVFAGKSF